MIFREIWSEHSLIDKEQKGVGEFFYFKYSFRDGLHRSTLREFFDSGTWQIYEKITNRNKSKKADPFWRSMLWHCTVLVYDDHISHPISSMERQPIILE